MTRQLAAVLSLPTLQWTRRTAGKRELAGLAAGLWHVQTRERRGPLLLQHCLDSQFHFELATACVLRRHRGVEEHGVTLGQLQRATIPRQSSSLSGQHITRNSIEPDQPANLCFTEWPASDAACSSKASRTRDLPTHIGEGGRRSSMQIETDAGRGSKTSLPQTSNLEHPAQARHPPLSESKHSAYEALQRCEETLQGTQTQAGPKKHAEPAPTQTTPESSVVAWIEPSMMRFSQDQARLQSDMHVGLWDPIASKPQRQ